MDTKLIFNCILWCLLGSSAPGFAQTCSDENDKVFMKGSRITAQDVQTCGSGIVDVIASVTSLLETCQFTSATGARTFAHCTRRCTRQDSCFALTYSSTNGCEVCIDTADVPGNGNTYDVSKIMVNLLSLRKHINGKFLAIS